MRQRVPLLFLYFDGFCTPSIAMNLGIPAAFPFRTKRYGECQGTEL